MRPAFLAAAARPFLRSPSTACSMSPLASVSAALQSIIGAPVRSRSCLTICAVTSMLALSSLLCSNRADKRKGQIDAGSTDLFATRPTARRRPAPDRVACRRLLGRSRHAARRGRVLVEDRHRRTAAGPSRTAGAARAAVLLPRHGVLFELAGALDVGVGDARREQPDGAD